MFPTPKPVLLLHLNGNVIRTKADHLFYTPNGWVDAFDLRAGDLLRTRAARRRRPGHSDRAATT
jgi:hypothetical protein